MELGQVPQMACSASHCPKWSQMRRGGLCVECLKLSQPHRGACFKSASLTAVHDIEEAIVILVISIDIRHQSRCTGRQTVLVEATGVQLLCWSARLSKGVVAGTDNRPGRQ